jgi:tRNA-2-methylthio-N6-dimethylallyladenosine synthase
MNEHDSERIAGDLYAEGYERTDTQEKADVIVLNTCCIRENADTKLYGHLGNLKKLKDQKPDLQIAVGGCLAQKDRDLLLERAPHVNAVFGTHNIGHLTQLLHDAHREGHGVIEILDGPSEDEAFPSALLVRPELPYAAWVTVQVGCDNSCAFCIVPAVRGPEQSRPFGDLVREVYDLARKGTTEVTLLGQNVNSYGRDLTLRMRSGELAVTETLCGERWANDPARRARPLFGDLLVAVGAIPGIRRVRYTSPHPKDLRQETIDAMANTPAVCEHLHLPLQSGSDTVLSAMRRGYTTERYLERLYRARREIDDLAVTTDIIVGFPGESEGDFAKTLELAAEVEYDTAFTFIFSPRPGTKAASMQEKFVAQDVVQDRFSRLKAVVDRSSLRKHQERIGRLEEVVVEGLSRQNSSVLSARTRQGKLVHFSSPGEQLQPGRYGSVMITGAGAHHLYGDLVELEDPPVAPTRRPLNVPLLVSQ